MKGSNPVQLRAEQSITWRDLPAGLSDGTVYIGPTPEGLPGIQVAVAESTTAPSRPLLRELHNARKGKTQTKLVVAVTHEGTTVLFGPDPQAEPIAMTAERAQRQLQSVLDEPNVIAAINRLAQFHKASSAGFGVGFVNSGLFAIHHLTHNVPQRLDWPNLNADGAALLSTRGKKLIEALGFTSEPAGSGAFVLSPNSLSLSLSLSLQPEAVAVLLDDTEQFEAKSSRFQLTPVAYGLALAAQRGVPWLVALRKDQIRLYPGRDGVGVGAKGQAETYFEIDLATLDADFAGLLPLVFSASALTEGGTTEELLRDSAKYATELGARLRERIYEQVVPKLAIEVANQLVSKGRLALDTEGLNTAYQVVMRILFRLLFQAYAEDRGLLPSGRNEGYDANSLKTNAQRLRTADTSQFGDAATIWLDLVQVWNAIDQGNPHWQVPAYNGGLFSAGHSNAGHDEGALIADLSLPDRVMGPALRALLVDVSADGGDGIVDFRSLSVREFGTIYEGLLESSLSVAEQDLTADSNGAWVPAHGDDHVFAAAGTVYFHSKSGERKATGSYFTPKVIVDYLIERSIVPALDAHLERIESLLAVGDGATAARDFFDFRVADLAMGSGHFLIAAVDKVEALMRAFLSRHQVPGVTDELLRLAVKANEALGTDDVAKSEVDEIGLLRRQIARRCIFGLDINPMAVELARLALWIHTFVPGLPMSNLDHGLVCANSLTGIGTIDEALDALQPNRVPGESTFFDDIITESLASAKTILLDAANASEASKAEVEQGARLLAEAKAAVEPVRRIFDAAVAARLGVVDARTVMTLEQLRELSGLPEVAEVAAHLRPAHMPVLFPEVFLRDNPGFDVLVGNPPWEEVMVEEPKFWLRVRPGLLGLSAADMKAEIARLRIERADLLPALQAEIDAVNELRAALLSGPYPGLGTGDVDLYQAFAWRFWQLLRAGGATAVVVPRSLFNAAGSATWREAVFLSASLELVTLVNNKRWLFPIHPQYSVALACLQKCEEGERTIALAGPFFSEAEFRAGCEHVGTLPAEAITATPGAAIPQLASPESAPVLATIRRAPRLDARRKDWDFRPVREFDATNDRRTFDAGAKGTMPVLGGSGFDIWNPETGDVYAYGDPEVIEEALQTKRRRQIKLASSAFHGMSAAWAADAETLPLRHPRIAFRDVTNATNTRTMIATLLPPGIALVNSAPYLLRRAGSQLTEAFLLGILSAIPFDWFARRYVELHMNFHIFNALPVPGFDRQSALAARVVEIAGRLAAVDERYAEWAAEAGVPVGSVTTQVEKDDLIAELDALVSLLYGLSEEQVVHVFATFHRGWAYQPRLDAVLAHFQAWRAKAGEEVKA